jgi:TolA-binding protein
MSNFLRLSTLGLLALLQVSCLRTRTELREAEQKKNLDQTVQQLAQNKADTQQRVDEMEEQNRLLQGRIEELQHQISLREKSVAERDRQGEERLKAYEDAVSKMQSEMRGMEAEILALKEMQIRQATPPRRNDDSRDREKDKGDKGKSKEAAAWQEGEESFSGKDWKKAILNYQKYREAHPKGQRYAAATLRIGLSFVELGMTDDAKVFLQEVVDKFPKSNEAKQARAKLKNIK